MDESLAKRLYDGVKKAYSVAAERPLEEHPFPLGRTFAESIGYPKELLDSLPASSSNVFAGVSNVSVFAEIPRGSKILDLGCGAGLDSLIAARKTGSAGRVIGIDFSRSMVSRARESAEEADLINVEFREGPADQISVQDGAIDVAIVNGIFNLNPNRDAIFRELARVVHPGGSVYGAELILIRPLMNASPPTEDDWFG